ncbi:MAG: Xaa-Pro peptidase family protein [Spirochaetia bacterium]|jgi:ectoine hydrolase|nr:Xaa-Pro peptidase family protein [Spirochaetia bacterium]
MESQLRFAKEEFAERIRRTKELMDHRGIEVLMVMDPGGMNYLSGYDGWSFYVHQGLLLSLNDDAPHWFGRKQDSNGTRITTWLDEDHIHGYEDFYVQSRYTHTMRYVAEVMDELGLTKKSLGLEMDGYWFNAKMYQELIQKLPGARLMDATNLVNWVKTIKSDGEINYIREASRICERVMQTAIDNIEVGVMEKDVASMVTAAQIYGTEEYGGSSPAIFPIMPTAERTSTAHMTFHPDRKYQKNDVVILELAGARYNYNSPLSRTMYLGEPPADLRRVSDVVIKGLKDTLEFVKPGISAEAVEERWRSNLVGTGIEKPSRVGYSFGLNYVPDWGEHTVSLRPGDKTILKPGMTIHFMPGIWLDTYGFECSEPFLVTETGCEKLIDFPEKLFIK